MRGRIGSLRCVHLPLNLCARRGGGGGGRPPARGRCRVLAVHEVPFELLRWEGRRGGGRPPARGRVGGAQSFFCTYALGRAPEAQADGWRATDWKQLQQLGFFFGMLVKLGMGPCCGLLRPWVSLRPAGCRAAQRKAAATSAAAAEEGKLSGKTGDAPALPVKDVDSVGAGPRTVSACYSAPLHALPCIIQYAAIPWKSVTACV